MYVQIFGILGTILLNIRDVLFRIHAGLSSLTRPNAKELGLRIQFGVAVW